MDEGNSWNANYNTNLIKSNKLIIWTEILSCSLIQDTESDLTHGQSRIKFICIFLKGRKEILNVLLSINMRVIPVCYRVF